MVHLNYKLATKNRVHKTKNLFFGVCETFALHIVFSGDSFGTLKDEVEFRSCDCIVKETVWNRPEKVDHLHVAHKNLCVLQGSGITKMIRNLAKYVLVK